MRPSMKRKSAQARNNGNSKSGMPEALMTMPMPDRIWSTCWRVWNILSSMKLIVCWDVRLRRNLIQSWICCPPKLHRGCFQQPFQSLLNPNWINFYHGWDLGQPFAFLAPHRTVSSTKTSVRLCRKSWSEPRPYRMPPESKRLVRHQQFN